MRIREGLIHPQRVCDGDEGVSSGAGNPYQLNTMKTRDSSGHLSVLMVDDHRVVTHGLCLLLKTHVRSIEAVETGEALLASLLVSTPDVVLLDIGLPGISGIQALEALRLIGFNVPVVMLSMYDDDAMVRRALEAGATGYVVKQASLDELLIAMDQAAIGQVFISPGIMAMKRVKGRPSSSTPSDAQLVVLRLAAKGLRAEQIAQELGVSRRTVESHKYVLMQHFGVSNTIALIRVAKEAGFI